MSQKISFIISLDILPNILPIWTIVETLMLTSHVF